VDKNSTKIWSTVVTFKKLLIVNNFQWAKIRPIWSPCLAVCLKLDFALSRRACQFRFTLAETWALRQSADFLIANRQNVSFEIVDIKVPTAKFPTVKMLTVK
jgi:hypothetical protein